MNACLAFSFLHNKTCIFGNIKTNLIERLIITMQVKLGTGRDFVAAQGATLLDAALSSGISLPYSCKTGRCNTCKCKIIEGETLALGDEIGLTAAEKTEGWILSCVRTAISDVVMEVEDLGALVLPESKTVPCRIKSIEKLAPDVLRVLLRLPPTLDFAFIPGQYINVIGLGGLRRSYSLANASYDKIHLELHIRAINGGAMSQYWFNQAQPNDLIRINGPLGTFFLRNVSGLDLIFLATGTGMAPVKAMLEALSDLAAEEQPRSVTVFWGGRTSEDLYLDMNRIPGNFKFVPVLSRADAQWTGARGHVQQGLLSLLPDLANTAVYACGSNAMIKSAKTLLTQVGLPSNRFYSDAFVCSESS